MPPELRPVVKRLGLRPLPGEDGRRVGRRAHGGRYGAVDLVAAMTGIGPDAAASATRRLLDGPPIDHVVVVGVAGAIDERLGIGDLVAVDCVVDDHTGNEYRPHPLGGGSGRAGDADGQGAVAGSLHTSGEFIVDPDRVAELRAKGVVALDMETAAVAAVCDERGRPWSVIRTISDRSSDGLADESVFELAGPDGSPNLAAVARFVVRHPGQVPGLVRLGRDMRVATQAAASALATAIGACRGDG
jgi:adenosylhomocysteine nucleosidase